MKRHIGRVDDLVLVLSLTLEIVTHERWVNALARLSTQHVYMFLRQLSLVRSLVPLYPVHLTTTLCG